METTTTKKDNLTPTLPIRQKNNVNMSQTNCNIGWMYYKGYYRDIRTELIEDEAFNSANDTICKTNLRQCVLANNICIYDEISNCHFNLTTTYPGLVTGIGISHTTKTKGEANWGLQFDHTTGAPIILASTIKGVIKSAFQHEEYILDILHDIMPNNGITKDNIKSISESIFDGNDIFFDALVVQYPEDTLIGEDYITPHKDVLKNPDPIKFLKVMPNVVFKFCFNLKDNDKLDAKIKKKLFKQIILDLGLGAKTNVGYGQLCKK